MAGGAWKRANDGRGIGSLDTPVSHFRSERRELSLEMRETTGRRPTEDRLGFLSRAGREKGSEDAVETDTNRQKIAFLEGAGETILKNCEKNFFEKIDSVFSAKKSTLKSLEILFSVSLQSLQSASSWNPAALLLPLQSAALLN